MARQSQETRLMREYVAVTSKGNDPHPELVAEMQKLGILNKRGLEECLAILHENVSGTYRNLVA